jgi:type IV fimbrial biogenesis protein FimT
MSFKSKQQGLNLIELMTVLTIAAIVLGAGIPALTSTIDRYNVKAEATKIVGSINFARSQAVNKQQTVTLAANSGGDDWSEGWTIYVDDSGEGDAAIAAADTLLKNISPSSSSLSAISTASPYLSFNLDGRLLGNGVSFAICDEDFESGLSGTLITVNNIGRVTLSTIAASNNKDKSCSLTADDE